MSTDLTDMSNEAFDDWLHDLSRCSSEELLTEEHLVELVSTTLREVTPESRARGFVDLANLCYAMAENALGSEAPVRKCLEVVVCVGPRH